MSSWKEQLQSLADLYGVLTSFTDVTGAERKADPDVLLQVLRAQGANLRTIEDLPGAIRERRLEHWRRWVEPVNMAWDGGPTELLVRLPTESAFGTLGCKLRMEDGNVRDWSVDLGSLPVIEMAEVEGQRFTARRLTVPMHMPLGYHTLTLERAGGSAETMLLAAPVRAYEPTGQAARRTWGVFLPLYALHSAKSWGAGDYSDMLRLTDWVAQHGGGMMATLPLLAAFLDEPFEPGPYSPASRLFWNEMYLDVIRAPEFERCPQAKAIVESAEFQKEKEALRSLDMVDHRRVMALKRRVLEEMARAFFAAPSPRLNALRDHLAHHPQLEDYARFRAVMEKRHAAWPSWPEPMRNGLLQPGDYEEEARNYHLYVQWLAKEQLEELARRADAAGPGLYLDMPLGANPDSYDVWRERDSFALNIAAGAPPDPFFMKGQNWGFPPLHPLRIRSGHYRYLRAYIQNHMQLAGVLRLDHMMGLHRLYWIPKGVDAKDGVYVYYPAQELYAVFGLESHRHKTMLVGEDLGTVPPDVRPAMERHNVHRMYVLQYQLQPHHKPALADVMPGSVASLNTHDMPPFAAFWKCLDVDDRIDLGILEPEMKEKEVKDRKALLAILVHYLQEHKLLGKDAGPREVLRGCLRFLSQQPAQVVLANLEDFWLADQPQNVPGTWMERPNWRRKARYALEELETVPGLLQDLKEMDETIREASV